MNDVLKTDLSTTDEPLLLRAILPDILTHMASSSDTVLDWKQLVDSRMPNLCLTKVEELIEKNGNTVSHLTRALKLSNETVDNAPLDLLLVLPKLVGLSAVLCWIGGPGSDLTKISNAPTAGNYLTRLDTFRRIGQSQPVPVQLLADVVIFPTEYHYLLGNMQSTVSTWRDSLNSVIVCKMNDAVSTALLSVDNMELEKHVI